MKDVDSLLYHTTYHMQLYMYPIGIWICIGTGATIPVQILIQIHITHGYPIYTQY